MIFSEAGWKAEVDFISAYCDEKGVKLTLRIIQTILRPDFISPEAIPKDGEIFIAFKSHTAGRHGWNISDF